MLLDLIMLPFGLEWTGNLVLKPRRYRVPDRTYMHKDNLVLKLLRFKLLKLFDTKKRFGLFLIDKQHSKRHSLSRYIPIQFSEHARNA